jgi:seryl-tRNA synthetase
MVEFFRKMTEWMLEKEAELAKRCALDLEDIDRQIAKVQEKKEALERQCRENGEELERILTRLKWIRAEELRCREEDRKNEKRNEGGV